MSEYEEKIQSKSKNEDDEVDEETHKMNQALKQLNEFKFEY